MHELPELAGYLARRLRRCLRRRSLRLLLVVACFNLGYGAVRLLLPAASSNPSLNISIQVTASGFGELPARPVPPQPSNPSIPPADRFTPVEFSGKVWQQPFMKQTVNADYLSP